MAPLQFALDVTPRARLALTDVRGRAAAVIGDELDRYTRCFYSSLHTTAGYLPQSLQTRLVGRRQGITSYLDVYHALFPERAGYRHDQLGERTELTAEQRLREPLNGDSHLMFILGGLRACVSYRVGPDSVYFVDLDGMCAGTPRSRTTVLVGYDDEIEVARTSLRVPVSAHPIEAVSLKDPRYGLYEQLGDFIARHPSGKGRLKLELAPGERHACLTVNEYETLLMPPRSDRRASRALSLCGREGPSHLERSTGRAAEGACVRQVRSGAGAESDRGRLGPPHFSHRAVGCARTGGAGRAFIRREAVHRSPGLRRESHRACCDRRRRLPESHPHPMARRGVAGPDGERLPHPVHLRTGTDDIDDKDDRRRCSSVRLDFRGIGR